MIKGINFNILVCVVYLLYTIFSYFFEYMGNYKFKFYDEPILFQDFFNVFLSVGGTYILYTNNIYLLYELTGNQLKFNIMNQVFLFFCTIFLGYVLNKVKFKKVHWGY